MKTPITDALREFFLSRDGHVTGNPRHVTAAKMILARIRTMELETIKKLNENAAFLQRRRERDRARQKKRRAQSCHVTAESAPLCDSNFNKGLSSKKESSLLRFTVSEATLQPKQRKGQLLDASWQPSAKHHTLATSLGHDERFVAQCADDMRDWAKANAHRPVARKSDWDATFSNWLRREAGKRPKPRRPSGPTLTDIANGQFHFGEQR